MIKCFKPFIKRQDMQSVLNCLVHDNVSPSIRKDELITEMCRFLNLSGGVPFRDSYRAVRTAFQLLELKPGDRILISPLAPSVYGKVASEMGIDLLFCDVIEETGCFNPELAHLLKDKEPSAVLLDYALGSVPDYSLVTSWKIPIIEDISQVLGGGTDGDRVGSRGDVTVLSMESRHILTTGGGTLLMVRQKSRAKTLAEWAAAIPEDLLMTDLNASLGVIQLRSLGHYLDIRRSIEEIYIHSLMKTHHKLLHCGEESGRIPYTFPVIVDSGRKNLVQYARKHEIETTEPFIDAVIMEYPDHMTACPVAESLLMRALAFPLYPGLKKDEINRVSRVLATLP
jgi:dTDP-4-amino-4,6-dideoxygalactose transaminase